MVEIDQKKTTMSLFGNKNTTSTASSTAIPTLSLGTSNASTNNTTGSSQTATSGGNLFGSKPTATSGMFGGQNNATSSTSGGMFGGQSNNPPALFGNQNTPASGLFNGSNTQSNSAPSNAPSAVPATKNLGTSLNSSTRLLKDLLEAANNLPKFNNSELGSISLTLNELQKKTQQLRKNTNESKDNYTKAHYLLASSGISAEEIENELNSIDIAPAQSTSKESPEPLKLLLKNFQNDNQPGNLDNYLNAKKDENILSAIELSLVSAFKDFDQFINQNVSIDWKVRRDDLRRSFGISNTYVSSGDAKKSKTSSNISWNKSLPGNYNILTPLQTKTLTSSSSRQLSRDKFENHAKIIYQLNEARLQNQYYSLCLSFEELNKSSTDLKSKQIADCWKILSELTNEKFAKVNQEQKFYDIYQNNVNFDSYTQNNQVLHKLVIKNSKQYLEQQFFNYMDEIYTKDDKKSSEFLPANNINKVSYFINKIIIKNSDNKLIDKTLNINSVPIWALIFYLLRSGLYNEAVDLVNSNRDSFNKFDKNFPVYISNFIENKGWGLKSDLQIKLSNEFNQQFQYINEDSDDFDPYKYSVYKIIGKCDLSKRSLPRVINLSIEDWLWFHLSIINEFNNEATSSIIYENYTLENLQKKVLGLGPKRFNSSSNNSLYLKALILTGLYELAVQHTYEYINECDAVHLAIGLSYYGLLKVSSFNNKDELIIVNSDDEYEINFSRLLGSYTRTFKISDPKVASQYLILIAISKGGKSKEEIAKCHEALRELILVSREFNLLLGELNPENGAKLPGILEKQRSLINLSDLSQFYHQIIEITAVRCEEEGRIFDALTLYQLCQDFDTVVSLTNKLLSEIFATSELDKPLIANGNYSNSDGQTPTNDTVDNNIILFSQQIMKTFNNNNMILGKVSPVQKQTNDLLLPIISIRENFYKKNWHQTILEIRNLGLIPIKESDDFFEIRKSVELLGESLDDSIVRVIPSLLIMIMTSISQLSYSLLTRRFEPLANERDELTKLRKVATNCMIYAGMVQYKMPRETYSLLINLESLL